MTSHSVRAVAVLLALAALDTVTTHRTTLAAAVLNPVQQENLKPGTSEWKITSIGDLSSTVEGYASLTSVPVGGQIKLYVSTSDPIYTIDIFRMGYYNGLGGRRMLPTITRSGIKQVVPPPDPDLGTVECNWIDPYVLNIPTDWVSGIYLGKLTAVASRKQQYLIFAVRDDTRASKALVIQAVNTYQAYNPWGGKSVYGTIAERGNNALQARKVSFDRPYYGDMANGAGQYFFSNLAGGREADAVSWLEKEGVDVTYATDVDVDAMPQLFLNHQAVLFFGHSEYWSWRALDAVKDAFAQGVSFGFFSGDVASGQVRLEPGAISGRPSRTLVHYRHASLDPIMPYYLKTGRFLDPGINRPTDLMTGSRYSFMARPPCLVIEDASQPLFTGMAVHNGQSICNPDGSPMLGYEVDSMGPLAPSNTHRLAHSPVNAAAAHFVDLLAFTHPVSGASVVSTGSIGWGFAAPLIQQLTRNIVARLIDRMYPDTEPIRALLPRPFVAADIGDVGRPGYVAAAGTDSFTITGAGNETQSTKDSLFYAYQTLAGDGEIVARAVAVENNVWGSRAGVMIRESLSPDAKYAAVQARPSDSHASPNEGADFRIRTTAATAYVSKAKLDLKMPDWLKLTRIGDLFAAYISADGAAWTLLGTATVPMTKTVLVGADVQGARRNGWLTARFDHVRVSGSIPPPPADTTKPTVAITAPANTATVARAITISATASDNVEVAGVQFAVDGVNLGSAKTAAPYSAAWDTSAATDGTHTLSATARDQAGNTATSTITVTVSNTTPPTGGCTVAFAPNSIYVGAGTAATAVAATWYINVANTTPCAWTAASDAPWLEIKDPSSGVYVHGASISLSGTVNLTVHALTNTAAGRVGHVTIGGLVYTVKQERAAGF